MPCVLFACAAAGTPEEQAATSLLIAKVFTEWEASQVRWCAAAPLGAASAEVPRSGDEAAVLVDGGLLEQVGAWAARGCEGEGSCDALPEVRHYEVFTPRSAASAWLHGDEEGGASAPAVLGLQVFAGASVEAGALKVAVNAPEACQEYDQEFEQKDRDKHEAEHMDFEFKVEHEVTEARHVAAKALGAFQCSQLGDATLEPTASGEKQEYERKDCDKQEKVHKDFKYEEYEQEYEQKDCDRQQEEHKDFEFNLDQEVTEAMQVAAKSLGALQVSQLGDATLEPTASGEKQEHEHNDCDKQEKVHKDFEFIKEVAAGWFAAGLRPTALCEEQKEDADELVLQPVVAEEYDLYEQKYEQKDSDKQQEEHQDFEDFEFKSKQEVSEAMQVAANALGAAQISQSVVATLGPTASGEKQEHEQEDCDKQAKVHKDFEFKQVAVVAAVKQKKKQKKWQRLSRLQKQQEQAKVLAEQEETQELQERQEQAKVVGADAVGQFQGEGEEEGEGRATFGSSSPETGNEAEGEDLASLGEELSEAFSRDGLAALELEFQQATTQKAKKFAQKAFDAYKIELEDAECDVKLRASRAWLARQLELDEADDWVFSHSCHGLVSGQLEWSEPRDRGYG